MGTASEDEFEEALQESLDLTDEEFADLKKKADAIEFVPSDQLVEVEPGHYVLRGELRERNDDE